MEDKMYNTEHNDYQLCEIIINNFRKEILCTHIKITYITTQINCKF